ncbi:MAG TPA: FMN-binding protein [Gaiellaceae bacterium]|nr:FMN-binding protein [Gaiellaceae bacterium]
MRKTLTVAFTVIVLAIPTLDGVAAARAATKLAQAKKVVTKTYTGTAAEADRWGTVTVQLKVQTTTVGKKVTRKYLDLNGNYTYHTDRSQFIMSQALPELRQEVLSAQSANVELISGATYTSQAFEQSLQSAILKAKA